MTLVLGNKIGQFVIEDTKKTHWGRFLRFKVLINLHLPLRRGIMVRSNNNQPQWVYFKYERLLTFCYSCGFVRSPRMMMRTQRMGYSMMIG